MRCFAGQHVVLLVLLTGSTVTDVHAETTPADAVFDSVAIYAGQGANHNLRELPERIIAGNPEWEKSYFNALGLAKVRNTLEQGWDGFKGTPFASIQQGYEMVLVRHHGLQDNEEIGAAYTLKTPDLALGAMGVNFGAGVGMSYALGNPAYEDGPKDNPAKRYRSQLLLLFDLEWRIRGYDGWSVVTRIHHRSGVYSLIAPRHVGSNFMAAGIRYRF